MSTLAANSSMLLIGRGRWFFDRFDSAGNSTGFRFVGEANKGEVTASVTTKERYTTTKRTNAKIANVITQQKHNLAIELMEFSKENVALAILGDASVVTQTQTTVASEVIAGGSGQAAVLVGRTYRTAMHNISGVTLVGLTAIGGTSTQLVAGTHYQIEDAGAGLITMLSVPAGVTVVQATAYTAGAATVSKVTAGTSANILGAWMFIGDPTSGPAMNVDIWKTEVTPNAALALLSDDFGSMTLAVEVLDDSANHPAAPLYSVIYPNG